MNGFRTYAFLLVLAATACSTQRIKGYEGPDLPDDRLVILKCSAECTEIDGRLINPRADVPVEFNDTDRIFTGEVRLLPGPHEIEYGYWCAFKPLIFGYKHTFQPIYANVNLEAGHVYKVVKTFETISFWRSQSRIIHYIQDLANGAILAKWSCLGVGNSCCGGGPFELINSTIK